MAQSKTSLLSSGKKFLTQQEKSDSLPKYNYGNGYGWCKSRDRKKANRGKGQTAGRVKNITCTYLDKYFAKSNRSYKHKGYNAWYDKTNKIKK